MIKRIFKNSALWSAVAVMVNTVMNLCIIPIVSNRLGVEAYGFVTLANTMITYIDIISLAINSFASRYVSIEYHNGKLEKANKYYSTVFISDVILSAVILLFMAVFVPNINHVLNVSEALSADVKLLFAIVFIRYIFVLLRSAFEIPAFIKNKLYLTEQVRTLSYVLQMALLILTCVVMPAKVWYVGVASAVAALFMLIAEIAIAAKSTPDLKIAADNFSKDRLKDVISSGIWNSINNIGNQLNSGLDLLITNKMLTELALGLISISKTFGSMCYILANSVSNALKPKQLEYYSKNEIDKLITEFKRAMRITGGICAIIIGGFFACGRDFLDLWLDNDNIDVIFSLSMIVLFGDIVTGVVNPLFYVYTLTKKIKLPCFITVGLGLMNVASMYFLIKYTSLGMYAVVLTTMVLNMAHFFDTPLYSSYCLKLPYKTFYPTILLHLVNVAALMLVMLAAKSILPAAQTWLALALKALLCGVIELTVSLVVMTSKEEKTQLVRKLKQRFAR